MPHHTCPSGTHETRVVSSLLVHHNGIAVHDLIQDQDLAWSPCPSYGSIFLSPYTQTNHDDFGRFGHSCRLRVADVVTAFIIR
jgi:hypothetical protein